MWGSGCLLCKIAQCRIHKFWQGKLCNEMNIALCVKFLLKGIDIWRIMWYYDIVGGKKEKQIALSLTIALQG